MYYTMHATIHICHTCIVLHMYQTLHWLYVHYLLYVCTLHLLYNACIIHIEREWVPRHMSRTVWTSNIHLQCVWALSIWVLYYTCIIHYIYYMYITFIICMYSTCIIQYMCYTTHATIHICRTCIVSYMKALECIIQGITHSQSQ